MVDVANCVADDEMKWEFMNRVMGDSHKNSIRVLGCCIASIYTLFYSVWLCLLCAQTMVYRVRYTTCYGRCQIRKQHSIM